MVFVTTSSQNTVFALHVLRTLLDGLRNTANIQRCGGSEVFMALAYDGQHHVACIRRPVHQRNMQAVDGTLH